MVFIGLLAFIGFWAFIAFMAFIALDSRSFVTQESITGTVAKKVQHTQGS